MSKKEKKPKLPLVAKIINGIFELLFYGGLVLFLAVVFLGMQSPDDTKTVAGYSMFYIETDSMRSVMPKGTLIITHLGDVNNIEVGDDITFHTKIRGEVEVVTHRVEEVHENYEEVGLAFTTKGVNNSKVDDDVVAAGNVIGKVVFSVPELGIYLTYLKDNLIMTGVLIALFIGLKKSISIYLEERYKEKQAQLEL